MEVFRMKSAQSDLNSYSRFTTNSIHHASNQQLEITHSTIRALGDALVAMTTGRLELAQTLMLHGLDNLEHLAQHFVQSHKASGDDLPSRDASTIRLDGHASEVLHNGLTEPLVLQQPNISEKQVRLEVKTLGKFEVSINAEPVRFPFARCGELLVWLALHGPASRDQICDALWDGVVTASNLEYFRVVVRRTRAALTDTGLTFNPLTFEDKLYRISNQLEVRIDALELAAAVNNPTTERLQKALTSYHGEFMPNTTHGWASLQRTLILDLAIEAAIQLAQNFEPVDPRMAIAIYRRAIQIEPLSEIAQTGLIRLHENLGETTAAKAVRRAYLRVLEVEG
jgi:DNA-binding SARP family transcriptional activator